MVYHYRNNRVKNMPMRSAERLCQALHISKEELERNVLKTFSQKKKIERILNEGQQVRLNNIKNIKEEIPSIQEVMKNTHFDVESWFEKYHKLAKIAGMRKDFKYKKDEKNIIISYQNYNGKELNHYTTTIPRKIPINTSFIYFFGLWVGDHCGGGRIGVANKEIAINLLTKEYLVLLGQKVVFDLIVHHTIKIPTLPIPIRKTFINTHEPVRGWCVMAYAANGLLKRFFDLLYQELSYVLERLPHKEIFFAGLFDAEGNVSLKDELFRWACKNKRNKELFIRELKKMNLFHRYDGGNIVCTDKTLFVKIIPYIHHPEKRERIRLIYKGRGKLPKNFLKVLHYVSGKPGKTNKEIAQALKRAKRSSQLRFLKNKGFIVRKGYPYQHYITSKGVAALRHGGKDQNDHTSPLFLAVANQ